jgi:hypothetical protein
MGNLFSAGRYPTFNKGTKAMQLKKLDNGKQMARYKLKILTSFQRMVTAVSQVKMLA